MVWKGTGCFCYIPQLVLCCRGELSYCKILCEADTECPTLLEESKFFPCFFEVNGMLYTSWKKKVGIAAAEAYQLGGSNSENPACVKWLNVTFWCRAMAERAQWVMAG